MSKVVEFKLGKGRTTASKEAEEWTKKYFELTVKLPEQFTEEGFHEAVLRAEYLVDNVLGQPEVPQVPEFDPGLLMNHVWKGKKLGENQYEKGRRIGD
jgi:hypothetical protein